MSLNGIDLSHHNVVTNWRSVAAANVDFAYIKATEGATYTDPAFSNYWEQAKNAGIRHGAYHFFRPLTSPEAQADHFCSVIGTLETGDLPPALDLEETVPAPDQWPSVPADHRVALAVRFLERLANNCGLQPIIYTRRGWVGDYLPDPTPLARYGIWLADYQGQNAPRIPAPWQDWTFWQHSENGTIPGIQTPVDLNRFFGSVADLATISRS